jgi:hypothetical protein
MAVAALLGVGAGAALVARSGGRDTAGPPVEAPEAVPVPPSTEPVSAEAVAGAIEVVQTGFTAADASGCRSTRDPCPPESVTVSHLVSYGVVIENDSDQVVKDLPIAVAFFDGAGEELLMKEVEDRPVRVARLGPGERTAIGATDPLVDPGAAEMRVTVGEPEGWMSPDHEAALRPGDGLVAATASEAKINAGARTTDGTFLATVSATVEVGRISDEPLYEGYEVTGRPAVIFRNERREIVGGVTDEGPVELRGVGRIEVDITSEHETFSVFSGALVEVWLNDVEARGARPGG